MKRLAFHEALGALNVGDLHPGGQAATEFLLDELAKQDPRVVLEVGAGIGNTTARMLKRGWQVVPIEPSDTLRHQLESRLGISAHAGGFEDFDSADGAYDVVLGESVFYGMDLKKAFAKVHRILRPGGLLATLDTVWTAAAIPDVAATIHDDSKRIFGIPMASREALTWSDWRRILAEAGFLAVVEKQIPPGSLKADKGARWVKLRAALGQPLALLQNLNHRRQFGRLHVPAGWTETWMAVWRRAE